MVATQLSSADDWPEAEPAAVGLASALVERIEAGVVSGLLANVHAVLVARRGKLVAECYFKGEDECWGRPLGSVQAGRGVRHDLRSVSKSVVGLLYGVALARDLVPGLDTPLLEALPDYPDLAAEPARRRLTVAHALTMTLGLAWDETLPYSDPRNSEIAMERVADRCRYVLEQPVVAEPGLGWSYNGGATTVLARIISRGAAMPLLTFARETLFTPLGIDDVEWFDGSDGEAAAASGLRMTARDLLRLGQLVLNRGRWREREVVPEAWLATSLTRHTDAEDGLGYGLHWWIWPSGGGMPGWAAGFGNGGQRLAVAADLDLTVVVFAGNYNRADAWRAPTRLLTEIVLPAAHAT